MTLDDLKVMDCMVITPKLAAQIIGCDPQHIRVAARQRPELLGFPVITYGTRTKIPRLPFIAFMEGKANE